MNVADDWIDTDMATYDIRQGVTPRRLENAMVNRELGLLSAATGVPVPELQALAARWGLRTGPRTRKGAA